MYRKTVINSRSIPTNYDRLTDLQAIGSEKYLFMLKKKDTIS